MFEDAFYVLPLVYLPLLVPPTGGIRGVLHRVHFSPGCPNFRQFRRLGMEPAGYLVRLCAGAATAIGRGRRNRRIFLGLRAPDPRPAAAVNGQRTLHPTPHATSRSEAHTSELKYLMRISYAVFCLN